MVCSLFVNGREVPSAGGMVSRPGFNFANGEMVGCEALALAPFFTDGIECHRDPRRAQWRDALRDRHVHGGDGVGRRAAPRVGWLVETLAGGACSRRVRRSARRIGNLV